MKRRKVYTALVALGEWLSEIGFKLVEYGKRKGG